MRLLGKRPGPNEVVRYREVSAIWDVRYKEVLLYIYSQIKEGVANPVIRSRRVRNQESV